MLFVSSSTWIAQFLIRHNHFTVDDRVINKWLFSLISHLSLHNFKALSNLHPRDSSVCFQPPCRGFVCLTILFQSAVPFCTERACCDCSDVTGRSRSALRLQLAFTVPSLIMQFKESRRKKRRQRAQEGRTGEELRREEKTKQGEET